MTQVGIIEGFFGQTWPMQDRLLLAPKFADAGISFYYYAPKADAYLRKAWRESFPKEQLYDLKKLSATYQQHHITFGVGLSPFEVWTSWNETSRRDLKAKLREIESLSPQSLCILLDDMKGDDAELARLQGDLMDFIAGETSIPHLVFCPTYYSFDPQLDKVFGERPADYLQDLGRLIPEGVDIFWTGPKVISPALSQDHLQEVTRLLNRKPFIWDNVLSNDGRLSSNFLNLDLGRYEQLPDQDMVSAIALNPMNQPWLSRFAVAEYCQLLGKKGQTDIPRALRDLLMKNLDLFQTGGLDQISPTQNQNLRQELKDFSDMPEVQEISNWLDGKYVFDPACLTD